MPVSVARSEGQVTKRGFPALESSATSHWPSDGPLPWQ